MSIDLFTGGISALLHNSKSKMVLAITFVCCTEGRKAEGVLLFLNHSHKSMQESQHQAYSFAICVL